MKFSQRLGITPLKKPIQIESIDIELRNGLWSTVKLGFIDKLDKTRQNSRNSEFDFFCNRLWLFFYKLPIDAIHNYTEESELFIRNSFFKFQWYEVYDFLEFLGNNRQILKFDPQKFKNLINEILQIENAAYRFIEDKLAPITNPTEINEIEEAISTSGKFTAKAGANIHLKNSLDKLSDKKSPDYRNSIKESISAVESVAKMILDNQKDTLGGAIDKLKSKIEIHPALVQGFKNIYGYTSDTDGIRHGLTEETNCDFEDAKFMLVSCSAFINYLIVKANKSGITLNK
jgi:hypothetical protein